MWNQHVQVQVPPFVLPNNIMEGVASETKHPTQEVGKCFDVATRRDPNS